MFVKRTLITIAAAIAAVTLAERLSSIAGEFVKGAEAR